MGGWEDGRMGGWEDGRMGGWEDGRMGGWEGGWSGGGMAGWKDGGMGGWEDGMGGWSGGGMDGWEDGRMAKWKERRMVGSSGEAQPSYGGVSRRNPTIRWEDGGMGGWEDGRMGGWSGGGMAGWEDGRMGGWEDGRMRGCEDGRMGGWEGGWSSGGMVGWEDGRMAGWQDGRMGGWSGGGMAGWDDGRMAKWEEGQIVGWSGEAQPSYGGVSRRNPTIGWEDGRMGGWEDGRMGGWEVKFDHRIVGFRVEARPSDGRIAGWEDGRLGGWSGDGMAGWEDGRMAKWQEGRMARWIAGWSGAWMAGRWGGRMAGWSVGPVAGWQGSWMVGWSDDRTAGWSCARMAGRWGGRMAGWSVAPDGRMVEWVYGRTFEGSGFRFLWSDGTNGRKQDGRMVKGPMARRSGGAVKPDHRMAGCRVLRDVQRQSGVLPPVFRLQADNCGSQNKNRYVFAYLVLLVKFRIFEVVEMRFMIVGHTHTDIDAKFNLFARKLVDTDAYTMDELFAALRNSTKDEVDCKFINKMADWKGAVKNFFDMRIGGHFTPHLFKFYMDGDNPAMVYKEHCNDSEWLSEGGAIYWFKRDGYGRWAGPSFPLEPCGLKLNLDNEDFVKGRQGVSALVEEWKDKRPEFEKHEDWKRQLKTSHLDYWEKQLDMFNKLEQEKTSRPAPFSTPFWPTPMTGSVKEVKVELPIVHSPPRKQCFVGYKSDAPKLEFDPAKHVDIGSFVVMRAPDENADK
ncbi:hypothetical protein CBR_g50433 [Chara braunii]|uniref:DUF7869 domain-containing protein n=1 Tax=Chara braunii TaxID=69332 RepID=A0A388M6X0_CHABU|nr:hypothetical protein CBR_g50433 [Chara braunii]|eukprot:GBG90255.1 hypothetical protein CBR_g50433 [Chara braunii]